MYHSKYPINGNCYHHHYYYPLHNTHHIKRGFLKIRLFLKQIASKMLFNISSLCTYWRRQNTSTPCKPEIFSVMLKKTMLFPKAKNHDFSLFMHMLTCNKCYQSSSSEWVVVLSTTPEKFEEIISESPGWLVLFELAITAAFPWKSWVLLEVLCLCGQFDCLGVSPREQVRGKCACGSTCGHICS